MLVVTVTIATEWNITAVAISANEDATTIAAGATLQFSATVSGDSGNEVTWTITNKNDLSNDTGISESGLLTVASDETSGNKIKVTATSKNDPTKTSAEIEITVS